MLSLDFMLLVRQELYRDMLRDVERERLIQAAGLRQRGDWRLLRKTAGWIGVQMASWGWKLQRYGTMPTPCQIAECR